MSKMPSIEVRRQRWLEFADFMASLPEEKFNHGVWCSPDHTCKTAACVAGWAGIQYSEQVKVWLDKVFERQRLSIKLNNMPYGLKTRKMREDLEKNKAKLYNETINLESDIDWIKIGSEALYIAGSMKDKLFMPANDFWGGTIIFRYYKATNKDIALIFRYLATLPVSRVCLPPTFEPYQAMMERRVAKFNQDQNNAAV